MARTGLRALRQQKMLTQIELARRLEVTPQAVNSWERGITAPRPATQRAMCEVLDVTPAQLRDALAVVEGENQEDTVSATTQTSGMGEVPLARKFDVAMVRLWERTRLETDYSANYFLRLVMQKGGLEAAQQLLARDDSSGLGVLEEKDRMDLSVEALVLDQRYRPLFTKDEIAVAKKRLAEAKARAVLKAQQQGE